MSFFITLLETTDASRRDLEAQPKIHSMIHHGLTLAEYRAFLHDLYHIVWHFCPIMAAAASRCDDRFSVVRYELYERIEEEKGHEHWLIDDIQAMGGDVEAAGSQPPIGPVRAVAACNYWASDRRPACRGPPTGRRSGCSGGECRCLAGWNTEATPRPSPRPACLPPTPNIPPR